MPSPRRPSVKNAALTQGPISLKPTLDELAAQALQEQQAHAGTATTIQIPADVTTAYLHLTWVLGHGVPWSLRRAKRAAMAMRTVFD